MSFVSLFPKGEALQKTESSWTPFDKQGSVLVAPLLVELGVRHGFSTRVGGVSTGRFSSLNLGRNWGDNTECVKQNLERVAHLGGFSANLLSQVRQVHGTDIVQIETPESFAREADGLVTQKSLPLGVLSADCVPLLLSDGQGRVAAVHAGWRGSVAGIAKGAVSELTNLGADVRNIRAVLGPSIGPCCFQVQQDVASLFASQNPRVVLSRNGHTFVDLWKFNQELLLEAGLSVQHVAAKPLCTCCESELLYSFRRDGTGIGQHLAFIVGGDT